LQLITCGEPGLAGSNYYTIVFMHISKNDALVG